MNFKRVLVYYCLLPHGVIIKDDYDIRQWRIITKWLLRMTAYMQLIIRLLLLENILSTPSFITVTVIVNLLKKRNKRARNKKPGRVSSLFVCFFLQKIKDNLRYVSDDSAQSNLGRRLCATERSQPMAVVRSCWSCCICYWCICRIRSLHAARRRHLISESN